MKKRIFVLCVIIILALSFFTSTGAADAVERGDDRQNIYVRGNHPRADGLWLQYYPLDTALRGNYIFSDILEPGSQFENYRGVPKERHNLQGATADNYDNTHNHYQNILSEVINFAEGSNAIAMWGDSAAAVNGAKAWGGFLSTRSIYNTLKNSEELQKYIPDGVDLSLPVEDFDAQLIGLEIDVLNEGKPGVYPNMSKTGLQIVGFGNPNSMAIEVRSEDTDKDVENRRGLFESGIYFKNSIADYGRVIVTDFPNAKMGLDFRSTDFSEGAIQLKSGAIGTGIVYNGGAGGEIFSGKRWEDSPAGDWITVRAGTGGFRVLSQDGTREMLAIDNFGGIYFNGDLYHNNAAMQSDTGNVGDRLYQILTAGIIALLLIGMLSMYRKIAKLNQTLQKLTEQNGL